MLISMPEMQRLLSALLLAAFLGPSQAEYLWPEPKSATLYPVCVQIDPKATSFSVVGFASNVLTDAIKRYASLTFMPVAPVQPLPCNVPVANGATIAINVTNSSTELNLDTDESYVLKVTVDMVNGISITAPSVFGALRGLETLSQLVSYMPQLNTWAVPTGQISDSPAFQHRGAMIDTSRHFLPLPSIYAFIDAMSYNKLNVLHWHLVDDQSFPFVSATFPNLSALGSYGAPNPALVAAHTYSPADVQAVISHAHLRGIRVLAEFDTPGHSQSWGASVPGLLAQCYNASTNQPIPGSFGPIDPTVEANFVFLEAFFREVTTVFPDHYVHLGGDEVSYTCWASNPRINAWMASNGIAPGDYAGLESFYVQRVLNLVEGLNKSYIAWQEVFDNGLKLASDTVVDVWKYHNTGAAKDVPALRALPGWGTMTWQEELYNVTRGGFRTVVSSPWYINYISYGEDWPQYLTADLLDFGGTPEQQRLVMGGEFSLWAEFIDATNLQSRGWPRGSAVAEALWSRPGATANITDATMRLHGHRCRLLARGIEAEPASGPSFCPQEWVVTYIPPWEQKADLAV